MSKRGVEKKKGKKGAILDPRCVLFGFSSGSRSSRERKFDTGELSERDRNVPRSGYLLRLVI